MINLNINNTSIKASNLEPLVEGNVKSISVKFVFSSEWSNLTRVAVFKNGQTKVSVSLTSEVCYIPWEVLTAPNEVFVSVRGSASNGNLVICTGNEALGSVEYSDASADVAGSSAATPTVLDTLLADVEELKSNIEDLESDVEDLESASGASGADGKSAYEIAVEEGYSGTKAQWLASLKGEIGATGASGPQGPQGPAGSNGSTPQRGVDYWTAADIDAIKGYVDDAILNGSW